MAKHWTKIFKGTGGILFVFLLLLLLITNSFLWPRNACANDLFKNDSSGLLFHFVFLSGFMLLLLNKNILIRKGSEIFLFSLLFMDTSYLLITGSSFGYYDAINLVNNMHYAGPAASSFIMKFVGAFLITGTSFVFIHLIRTKAAIIFRPKHALLFLPLVVVFAVYSGVDKDATSLLPSPLRVPLSLSVAAKEARQPVQPRETVSEKPGQPQVIHIFLVVDESIAGSSLSINGGEMEMTPFLQQHQDSLINFGTASSFTNYSAGSNICLISGMRQNQLPDTKQRALRQPSLFQYAKAAGYKTYYIDAQTSGRALQNFLTNYDLKNIDVFMQPADYAPAMPLYKRDAVVSDMLVSLAKEKEKSFVYVNKAGAHWPYANSHPPDVGNTYQIVNNTKREYHLAVTWSVDKFWERMINGITASDSCTLIYTSDHGEFVDETGYTAAGHGRLFNPDPSEGQVPLIIYDRSQMKFKYKVQKNKAAHEQIFPTTLLLMGFTEPYVFSRYGPSLFHTPESGRRWFLSGDVFGRSRTFKTYVDD